MTTHFSILTWRILWTEEPGGLQATGHEESDATERLSASEWCSAPFHVVITAAFTQLLGEESARPFARFLLVLPNVKCSLYILDVSCLSTM